jgi:hypothetical protein
MKSNELMKGFKEERREKKRKEEEDGWRLEERK